MNKHLDLDDCVANNPGAAAELAELRRQLDCAINAADRAIEHARRVDAKEREALRMAVSHAVHQLEKARIWNGMEWHYNPLHPLHYRSALERLRDVLPNVGDERPACSS